MKRFIAALSVFAMFLNVIPLHTAQAADGSVNLRLFRLDNGNAGNFALVASQPTAAGGFDNGSVSDYPEGSCIPMVFEVTNSLNVTDDVTFYPVFDYFGSVVGIDQLEQISATLADTNLSQMGFTGIELGDTASMTVEGPFAGDNTGTTPTSNSDAFRHYNVTLLDVPRRETVNVFACARLSDQAADFTGASLSVRNGVGGAQNRGIQTNQVLELPEVNVIKVVSGGTSPASAFTLNMLASNPSLASFPGSTGTVVTFDPGAYQVTENPAANYTPSFSAGCSGTLAYDAAPVTCTVTNTFVPTATASYTITKQFVGAPEGTEFSDFSYFLSVDGDIDAFPTSFDVDGVTVIGGIEVGTLMRAIELNPADPWVETYSDDCGEFAGVAMDADGLNCVITNTYTGPTTGTITVTKDLVTDDGSTDTVDSFVYAIDGTPVALNTPIEVAPGAHTVTESWAVAPTNGDTIADRYTVTYGLDCADDGQLDVVAGDDLTCAITNDDLRAQLTVIKLVNGGPQVISSDFDMIISSDDVQVATFDGSAVGVATALDAGVYTVGEVINPDYIPHYTGDCDTDGSITLVPGQSATCTVSNEYSPLPPDTGRLTVVKTVVGSQAADSDFSYVLTQNSVAGAATAFVNDTATEYVLDEGTEFSVDEVLPVGYTVTDNGNCSGTIVADALVECVITNTFIPVDADLEVIKTASAASVENGSNVTFTLTVTNHGPAAASNVVVNDVLTPGDFTFVSAAASVGAYDSGTGVWTVGGLAVDASATLDIVVTVSGTDAEVLTNTVTIDADNNDPIDENNSDSVDVTVTVTPEPTATLTVQKIVVNSVNTNAPFTDFSYYLSVDGGEQVFYNFDEDGISTFTLPVGTDFTVVEVDHGTAWDAGYVGCEGTVTADGATCTITNTYNDIYLPTEPIRLIDPCIAAGEQGRLIAQFGYESDNADVVTITAGPYNLITGDSTRVMLDSQTEDFDPGVHAEAFRVDFDAALTVNWSVDWDLDAVSPATVTASADSRLCVPPEPATLTVYKIVNNQGGDAVPGDFTLEVRGTDVSLDGVDTGIVLQIPGNELGTAVTMSAGEFSVTELNGTGFNVTYSDGCAGTAEAGQDYSCTVTNTEIAGDPVDGSLTVNVIVNGGSATPALFNVYLNGETITEFPHDTAVTMAPGGYTIFEEPVTGYETTFSGDCSGTFAFNGAGNIGSDEDAICTITNTYVGGPSGGGSSGSSGRPGGNGNDDPTPPGEVQGDTDEQEVDEEDPADEVVVLPPPPIVAGESDELPRTGVPIAGVLALGSVLTFLVRRKEQE